MPDHDDELPLPVHDLRALADFGLSPTAGPAIEDRARARFGRKLSAGRSPLRKRLALSGMNGPIFGRVSRRAVVLSFVAVAFGGTALAATTPWTPELGDEDRGHPTVATTVTPGDQAGVLAVLRRPQTEEDRGPQVQAILKKLNSHEIGGVRLEGVRLLAKREGGASVLVPVERSGANDQGAPAQERHDVLCFLYGTDHNLQNGDDVGLGVGQNCGTAAEIAAGSMVTGGYYDGKVGLTGLVPDGVARIEFPLRTGTVLSADVVNNTFDIEASVPDRSFDRSAMRWIDTEGREVHPTT